MADISRITLPSGVSYDIKDATARSAIAGLNSFDYLVCTTAENTPLDVTFDDITGTLVPSPSTTHKIYLVPSTNGERDVYDEYITVTPDGSAYSWELFGNTDAHLEDLGDLAYKNTASTTYTPEGELSAPVITVDTAGSTTTVNSITDVGSLPSLTTEVVNEVLTISFSAGTLPTKGSDTTVKTSDASYTASAPNFTGTQATITVS